MQSSLKAAVQNIATFGDTDIFPYSFEHHIFHDRPELLKAALLELHDNFEERLARTPPDNINTLAPVGYMGFRWATQIDPLWNAYYLSLVIELGSAIESARVPIGENAVFSYRFVPPNPEGRIFDDAVSWQSFLDASIAAADTHSHVVMCDISDFYARIYHHRVENALKWLNVKGDVVRRIVQLLQVFSGTVSYGLPVGGPASRLLAELALNGVDQLLRSEGIRFCRFVDDYRIFCTSREEAYQRLIFLSEKLFNEGLALQKNKTRILPAADFSDEAKLLLRKDQQSEEGLTEEEKLVRLSIRFDPYSETRVDDYELIKRQVANVDISGILGRELEKTRIDSTIVKQAISVLRVLEPSPRSEILRTLLRRENLDTLAPVFPRLMTVLRGLYPELDAATQAVVDSALIELIRSGSHLARIDLNLAYMLRVLRYGGSQEKELLFTKIFRGNTNPLVRREVILGMAGWHRPHWLSDIKKNFLHGLSSWERRCFIIASYYLGDEGNHWRQHTKSSFAPFELIVRDWFSQRFQTNKSVPW